MCKYHRRIDFNRQQLQAVETLWNQVLDRLWDEAFVQEFSELRLPIDTALENGVIIQPIHDLLITRAHTEWMWYRDIRIAPIQNAKTELERLALDNQNVHTPEVNKQTSDAMDYLLNVEVPDAHFTVAELDQAWSNKHAGSRKRVIKDIKKWYCTAFCISDNDWLYKRMLDGLWIRIQEHQHKAELIERLWEEASESVEMCCQGHLSRLANVLVGFTEEVKAVVPLGEILQQKISAIASKEIGVEYKVGEAWEVFDELNVPMEERNAWIEAF
jgi:hypothetical protein